MARVRTVACYPEYAMATPAQIAANRRNALKSTGPRTAAGKARSRMNALKHGLRAATIPHVARLDRAIELEHAILIDFTRHLSTPLASRTAEPARSLSPETARLMKIAELLSRYVTAVQRQFLKLASFGNLMDLGEAAAPIPLKRYPKPRLVVHKCRRRSAGRPSERTWPAGFHPALRRMARKRPVQRIGCIRR